MSRPTIPAKRPAADTQEAAWVADEDRFVLQQARKKAAIRVRGGRAQPIDWLAVTLAVVDPARNPLEDELEEEDLELRNPEDVLGELDNEQLRELEKGITTYVTLEQSKSNVEYWNTMRTICQEKRKESQTGQSTARGVNSVSGDLDKLLGPKSLAELEKLESQIAAKLSSNEPVDTDYWEHLLKSLLVHKARAKLRQVSQSIVNARMGGLRKQQATEADAVKQRLRQKLDASSVGPSDDVVQAVSQNGQDRDRHSLDPEPLLRLRPEDKQLYSVGEKEFAQQVNVDRRRILKIGFLPLRQQADTDAHQPTKRARIDEGDPSSQSATSLFDREVARGVGENEEVLTTEESVSTKNLQSWSGKYRPRKPRYFNRVQTGYEWNKYNQTHYDHDNPPPKVVQGYKFNVFYPDLIDKTKAPTYKIEREGGRRRGESFAPAGEEDTCLIRFIAGPPYEDIAFRIVDKEWDYSAKRERGFRSSFDKGILQLHFQFKKIYYRK